MSSAPPNPPPVNDLEKDSQPATATSNPPAMQEMDTTPDAPVEETWSDIPEDVMALPTDDILMRIRLIDNDIKVCRVQ